MFSRTTIVVAVLAIISFCCLASAQYSGLTESELLGKDCYRQLYIDNVPAWLTKF
jgi:hypothetical protein